MSRQPSILREAAAVLPLLIAAVAATASLAWISLYVYLGIVSLLHGEGAMFLSDISREYTPRLLAGAAIVLVISVAVLTKAWRALKRTARN